MADHEVESKIEWLLTMPKATALKQIYEWVKTGHINLCQFRGMISHVTK